MKRLAMMATFALLSTGAAAFQAAGRPAPFQTAAPCDNPGCALLCANWRCA
jgi:hypothetical protein